MKISRVAAALILPLSLAACSFTTTVDPDEVASKAEEALQKQVGADVRPDIDCGDDKIEPAAGKAVTCALTVGDDPAVYDVTVTFREKAEDGTYPFDVKVADTPRA